MSVIALYSYFRSSAAYRVRIALNLKQLEYEIRPVHLVRDGGEQHSEEYRSVNPQALVPTLVHGEFRLSQSMAIMEYLDEVFPEPALIFGNAEQRAKMRMFAQLVCSDIHPLNNLRILNYLKSEMGQDDASVNTWYHHWITEGFSALEAHLKGLSKGPFCFGEQPGLADICLVPQWYNALRFECDVRSYHRLGEIYEACMGLPSFIDASPEKQSDSQ